MPVTFKCVVCRKISDRMPKNRMAGHEVKCPFCGAWQMFKGNVTIEGIDFDELRGD